MSSRARSATQKAKNGVGDEAAGVKARFAELEEKGHGDPVNPRSEKDERDALALEDALIASEVRYRRLFESAKDGILILDAETGVIVDVNPFLEEMLGYGHRELIGCTLWEIGAFKDIAANKSAFRQLQTQEYIKYDDLPLKTKTGEQKQVEFVSNVYLVDGARVIQCNIRDITDRHNAEKSVQKANENLVALVEELRQRDGSMQLINRLNDLLQSCTSQEEAFRVIAVMGEELFPGLSGCVAILHSWDQHLETVARWGEETPLESNFCLDDCWAMRRGQPHEVLDPRTSLLCRHFVTQPERGYLCIPMTVQGEILGLLCLIGYDGADRPDHRVRGRQLALTVGEAIKLSLSNLKLREKLREQATRDPLTGLFNRRYLEECLSRELHRTRRGSSQLCIAMLDLDHFKRLNDTFGHEAGDVVLREVGQVLRDRLRKSDISCRYGGEEFVLVLPDSSLTDTSQRVEQIRVLVKELKIRYGDQVLSATTVSAGIAGAQEHGSNARDLLRAADDALYAAKQAGRDRVVIYQPRT